MGFAFGLKLELGLVFGGLICRGNSGTLELFVACFVVFGLFLELYVVGFGLLYFCVFCWFDSCGLLWDLSGYFRLGCL